MKLKEIETVLKGNVQYDLSFTYHGKEMVGTLYWNRLENAWEYDDYSFTDEQLSELNVISIHPDWMQLVVTLEK